MTTYLSDFATCGRCGSFISDRSVFAVALSNQGNSLGHDIIRAKNLKKGSIAIHMGGDRECRREQSGFHGKILKSLGLPMSCDTSFLERL